MCVPQHLRHTTKPSNWQRRRATQSKRSKQKRRLDRINLTPVLLPHLWYQQSQVERLNKDSTTLVLIPVNVNITSSMRFELEFCKLLGSKWNNNNDYRGHEFCSLIRKKKVVCKKMFLWTKICINFISFFQYLMFVRSEIIASFIVGVMLIFIGYSILSIIF